MAKDFLRNDGQLYRAIVRGDGRLVAQELCTGDVDLSLRIEGRSLLWHAGERGHKWIAELLIRAGLDPNEQYGQQQRSLLHFAAATFNYGFAGVLLDAGAKPSPCTTNGTTPLHLAARTGQAYLAVRLLDAGATIDSRDSQGRTPLMLAFNKGMTDVTKILSTHGGHEPS